MTEFSTVWLALVDWLANGLWAEATWWQVLLVTLEYQPEQQLQPPFSVGEMEVRTLFERDFGVEVLGRGAELDHPRVLSGQLSYFDEVAYRLIRRG